ncbi:MAG: DUF4190 domain-containing protein [Verrucomicrobiales bacterium]|nr:DUF4190 domain-containing protein [Verrucomicrobiales bacterium]
MPWHYVNENREQAEVPDGNLEALVSSGAVTRDTLIWQDGMADWLPAAQAVPDLFPDGQVTPVTYAPAAAQRGAPANSAQQLNTAPPKTSGLAIAALICGILGLTTCWIFSAIPGAVCGHMALSQIRLANNQIGGRGLAIAGLVTSYISIAGTLLAIILYLFMGLTMFGLAAASSGITSPP